jgi:hypothetical protein
MQKYLKLTVTALTGLLAITSWAGDLSSYRNFRFGSDLETVAKLASEDPGEAKLIQSRPARIEELTWRPHSYRNAVGSDAVNDVVFTFYEGELYQITVNYYRYETAGMTNADVVKSVSEIYGPAESPKARTIAQVQSLGEPEELVAHWEDAEHSFNLTRKSYGPTYKLVGILKRLCAAKQASTTEAARLDRLEAPQRAAAAAARRDEAEQDRLEKERLRNKGKFRP